MGRLLRHFFVLLGIALALELGAKDVVVTISRTDVPPVIDGVLDDSIWVEVEPITGFLQYHPVEGIAPSESTALYIAYDEDNFYLAFRCFDSNVEQVRATMTQRESWDNDDCVGFAFDTYNSEREAFLFNINPYGIPSDFIWHHDGYTDNGWDADLQSKGRIFADSYCIECAVPFKSLRMPHRAEQEWGFYALRSIKYKGEFLVWPPRTHHVPNLLAQASLLRGLKGVETGRNLAVLPYLFSSRVGDTTQLARPLDIGVDLRYGITSALMADMTLNPDYSQIEADPDRVELSERYAQTLPEKRPFFTEGIDIFASNQWLFYSRRITNPLAGFKLTGKVGRNRIGFLSAVDDPVGADEYEYYNHLRVRRDVFDESSVGLLFINKDNFQEKRLNRVLSVDGVLRFRTVYSLKAQITGTLTREQGEETGDVGYNLNLERFGANSYHSLWYDDFPPDFQVQSGAMWEVIGYRTLGMHHGVFLRQPLGWINDMELHGGGKLRFNHENELREEYVWTSAEMSLDRLWTKIAFYRNHEEAAGTDYIYSQCEYELWNSLTRYFEYYLSALFGSAPMYDGGFTGWKLRTEAGVTVKPVPRVILNTHVTREDFYREYGGAREYLQTVWWNKFSLQVRSSMFVRGIYQYNSMDESSDASLLFAFEYSPLSNIYVGTNFRRFSEIGEIDDNMEFFVKIGYLWRL